MGSGNKRKGGGFGNYGNTSGGGYTQSPTEWLSQQGGQQAPQQAPAQGATPWQGDPMQGQRFQLGQAGTGAMTQAPSGWDFTSPGVGEQFWHNQQNRYNQPGAMGQWWGQNQGAYGQPGAAEVYQKQVNLQGPTASEQTMQDPGLEQYYSRARNRATAGMNDQLAARGIYGSSAGVDQIGQTLADLNAQQANREADYALRQAGQSDAMRLQQAGLGGSLAAQAQANQLARLGQAGGMAGAADSSDLARLNAGMAAASGAQDLRRTRGRDYMSDIFSPTQLSMGAQAQGMDALLAGDQAQLESAIAMALGIPREALNQDYRNMEQHRGDIYMVMDLIQSIKGMGGQKQEKQEKQE